MSVTSHPLATGQIVVVDDNDYLEVVTEMVFDQTGRTFRVPILPKPFTREELSAVVARVLAK